MLFDTSPSHYKVIPHILVCIGMLHMRHNHLFNKSNQNAKIGLCNLYDLDFRSNSYFQVFKSQNLNTTLTGVYFEYWFGTSPMGLFGVSEWYVNKVYSNFKITKQILFYPDDTRFILKQDQAKNRNYSYIQHTI